MKSEYVLDQSMLQLLRDDAQDTLNGFRLYLKTLEKFIDEKEEEEIASIKARFPDGAKINWPWHYPIHWEDVFCTQLRSSFVVTLISFLEIHLKRICKQVHQITASPIEYNELKRSGTYLDHFLKYLKIFGRFNSLKNELWESVNLIYSVRNCIVHNNNDLYDMSSDKKA